MFSKKREGAILGLIAFSLVGCMKINEKQHRMEYGFNKETSQCMDQLAVRFDEYIEGNSSQQKIEAQAKCVGKVLDLFSQHVFEESPEYARQGIYTREHLRNFLNYYFFRDKPISPSLMEETFLLKMSLFGGDVQTITIQEITKFKDILLETLKEELNRLRPHFPLAREEISKRSLTQVATLERDLEISATRLGYHLQSLAKQVYPFERFRVFLQELENYYGSEKASRRIRFLLDHLNLLQESKAILVSGEDKGVGPSEWRSSLEVGARVAGIYYRYKHLRDNYSTVFSGEGFNSFYRLLYEGDLLLKGALGHYGASPEVQVIPFEKLDDFVRELGNLDYLPYGVTVPTTQDLLRPLFRSMVGGPNKDSQGRLADGFTYGALERVWSGVSLWAEGQRYLQGVFGKVGGNQGLDQFQFAPGKILSSGEVSDGLLWTTQKPHISRQAVEAMRSLVEEIELLKAGRLYRPDFPRVYFYNDREDELTSLNDLSKVNSMRTFAETVFIGYIEDPNRVRTLAGVTKPELEKFYYHAQPIGVELGVFDANSTDSARRRFDEAKWFTYPEKYPQEYNLLNLAEGTHLMAYLLSGKEVAKETHFEIARTCPSTTPDRPNAYPLVDAPCFRAQLFTKQRTAQYWSHMPRLKEFYDSLEKDPARQEDFRRDFETLARSQGYSNSRIDAVDSDGFALVSHYLETLFARFDRDHSGTLSVKETLEAVPRFQRIICQLGETTSYQRIEAIFTYYLKNGTRPEGFPFLRWEGHPEDWQYEVDRAGVLKVLARFKEGIRGNGIAGTGSAKVAGATPPVGTENTEKAPTGVQVEFSEVARNIKTLASHVMEKAKKEAAAKAANKPVVQAVSQKQAVDCDQIH